MQKYLLLRQFIGKRRFMLITMYAVILSHPIVLNVSADPRQQTDTAPKSLVERREQERIQKSRQIQALMDEHHQSEQQSDRILKRELKSYKISDKKRRQLKRRHQVNQHNHRLDLKQDILDVNKGKVIVPENSSAIDEPSIRTQKKYRDERQRIKHNQDRNEKVEAHIKQHAEHQRELALEYTRQIQSRELTSTERTQIRKDYHRRRKADNQKFYQTLNRLKTDQNL